MKQIFLISIFILFIQSLFSQKAINIQSAGSTASTMYTPDQYPSPLQENSIIGSWSLVLQAFDDNNNGKLDDEERKKGNTGRHFYQFNTDGTCLIHTLKLKGCYELKNENGKKRLYTYIDDSGSKTRENAWYVISVSKTEMILLSQDKYAFWIYKRV